MKLYRFIAEDNQKAMIKAQASLGPEALIYSTKKVEEGIEVLAGIAEAIRDTAIDAEEVVIEKKLPKVKAPDQKLIESITSQFKKNDIHIKNLSVSVNVYYQIMTEESEEDSKSFLETAAYTIFTNYLKPFYSKIFRIRKNIIEGVYGSQATQ